MSNSLKEKPPEKKKKKYIKKSAGIVFFPVTLTGKSVFSSAMLFYKSIKTTINLASDLKNVGNECIENVKSSGHKKGNHSFHEIFNGSEKNDLIKQNEKKFLLRKRITIALLILGIVYSIANIIILGSLFGILTFFSTIVLSTAYCLESAFRIWQLRNQRLSVEEKGGLTSFLSEEPILSIFDPEIFARAKSKNEEKG